METATPHASVLDQWHPVAAVEDIPVGEVRCTRLLGIDIAYAKTHDDALIVWRRRATDTPGSPAPAAATVDALPVIERYLYLWTSLGSPPDDLFAIAEFDEPDRRNVHAGTIGVHVSAPRAIENFLDMGHFPYVHSGYLGIEPHTEVADYEVHVDDETGDIWATECVFYQPMAAAASTEGQMSDYVYRVPHPYCVMLYKTTPVDEQRMDVIALFCHSLTEDTIEANMMLSVVDEENADRLIRRFQQTIFGQDKPILENQYPKRLPLDPRAETPIRADKVAIVYRRWLAESGVDYGVIRAS